MAEDRTLLQQLSLPMKEQMSSFNIRMPLKVLTYMFTMVEIVNAASYYLKLKQKYPNMKRDWEEIRATRRQFAQKLKDINYNFVSSYEKVQNFIRLIIKIRTEEILQKIKAQQHLWKEKGTDQNKHLFFYKQTYMKIFRLRNFIYYNETRLGRIASLHELLATKSQKNMRIAQIDATHLEESKLQDRIHGIRRELEYQWTKQKGNGKKSLTQLKRLAELVDRTEISNKMKLGIWTGILLFMVVTIIYLIINYDINFTSEPQFEITFPIWRGVCYFILLIWLFAIQSYVFETFGINFRLMTVMNNYYIPKYPVIFVCAAVFTSIHLLMFMFYIFALAEFGITFPDNFQLHYLPAVSWIALFLFFIVPVPIFHFNKRMYPLFMLFRALFAPILGIEFKFHWWTEIWISFRQPFRDLMFTMTYYFIDNTIVYEKTIIFQTVAGVLIYMLRIIQNTRQMYQSKVWGGMPFYGSIKCTLNIITMITSYFFRIQENQLSMVPLTFWVISAIASTSYAYYFDLKWDWGLLQNNKYLRKQLLYGTKKLYYSIIVLNLLFRFVWVMNISPDILRSIPLQRYFLIMVVSCIQIFRRVAWSILRIQKQHIMTEKYYDSIGITRNREEQQKDVAFHELLVEAGDLNKTFSVENEKFMKDIYQECENQMMSPTRLKKKLSKEKGYKDLQKFDDMQVRKTDLLEALSQQIQTVQETYNTMHIIIRDFLARVDQQGGTSIDFDTDRYVMDGLE